MLVSISAASWAVSRTYQLDMMSAMMPPLNPASLSVFVAVWTAGMAAMMFPAISPVVLLYNRLIRPSTSSHGTMMAGDKADHYHAKMIIFVGSYLAVWSMTGLALLFGWTTIASFALSGLDSRFVPLVYGSLLLVAGLYQFTPLKTKCLGYCESPMSLFMRRWKGGSLGALSMGTYHGIYCLGCCWPYFMIMVALGWMDVGWMGLFAGVILGEKLWSRGVWIARAAGAILAVIGILAMLGIISIVSAPDLMAPGEMTMDPDGMTSTEPQGPTASDGDADMVM